MSIIDASLGYHKLQLDTKLLYLTTFACPFGRYQYKHLLFRAAPVGDMFQHKIDEIFNDMPNVFGIADDVLVVGYDEDGIDHNEAVYNVLRQCKVVNLKLNKDKCVIWVFSRTEQFFFSVETSFHQFSNMASSGLLLPGSYAEKSGVSYRYKCDRVDCDEEYIGECSRTFGERFKEHQKAPSSIYDHYNITGHVVSIDNFSIVGREDQNLMRPSRKLFT